MTQKNSARPRFIPLLLALAALFLHPLGAAAYTTVSPPAYLIDGAALDPVCFLNDWSGSSPEDGGDGISFYPVADCRVGEITVDPVDDNANPDYVGASYAEDFNDDADGETYTEHGYVAYRYIGDVGGRPAFIVVQNMGGSGYFSTLALYEPGTHTMADGGTVKVLRQVETFAGGDRCNGGVADASVTGGKLSYSVNVTPYDMLFLTGNPERAILKSEKAEEVVSCSVCCYALAHFTGDGFTGMTLNKDNLGNLEPNAETGGDTVMGCVDGLVKLNIEGAAADFDADGTQSFIREIEHVCLGRMEGEE